MNLELKIKERIEFLEKEIEALNSGSWAHKVFNKLHKQLMEDRLNELKDLIK